MYKETIEEILDLYGRKGNKLFTILKFIAVTIVTGVISIIIAKVFSNDLPLRQLLLVLTAIAGMEHIIIAVHSHKLNERYIKAEEDRDEALRARYFN